MGVKPISVFACESQPVVVEGLQKALERSDDFRFAGAAANPAEVLDAIVSQAPDIALVDHEDGASAALALVSEISQAASGTQVILWVKNGSDVPPNLALHAGARGVLEKHRPLEALIECLRVVASGQVWFENGAVEPSERDRRRVPRLTPRERQILVLLAQGMKNVEIAQSLSISPGTVKVHLMHIFEKTGARDRYELAVRSRKLLGHENGSEPAEPGQPGEVRDALH